MKYIRPFIVLLTSQKVLACAVCFGDVDSPLTKGLNAAILFLVGVVGFVLASISLIAFSWSRRAKRLHLKSVDL